jgi:hypothetical protein
MRCEHSADNDQATPYRKQSNDNVQKGERANRHPQNHGSPRYWTSAYEIYSVKRDHDCNLP